MISLMFHDFFIIKFIQTIDEQKWTHVSIIIKEISHWKFDKKLRTYVPYRIDASESRSTRIMDVEKLTKGVGAYLSLFFFYTALRS